MKISLRGRTQRGFTLVELLVGVVVGLIASGAIIQTFSTFEGQKRSTVAGSEAQENGLVALALMEQDIHNAGAGFADPAVLDCAAASTYTYSSVAGGPIPNFTLAPLVITAGATATTPDSVQITTGDFLGGLPAYTVRPMAQPGDDLQVSRTDGFAINDMVIVAQAGTCSLMQVTTVDAAVVQLQHRATSMYNAAGNGNGNGNGNCNNGNGNGNNGNGNNGNGNNGNGNGNGNNNGNCGNAFATGARVLNPKTLVSKAYQITNGNLQLTMSTVGSPPTVQSMSLVRNLIFMKAQYGVAPAASQSVDTWVDATGTWSATSLAASPTNRKRIKAIRLVVVARSDRREAANVTPACTNVSLQVNNGPCAWPDTAASPAPLIDLSANPDWQHYRYKVYQTIVPLRNVIWDNV